MRLICVLSALVLFPALHAADEPGAGTKPISPAEATKLAKEKLVTVEMVVKSTGKSKERMHWWLDSEADYKSDKNFAVFIHKEAVEKFMKNMITDPEKQFKGQTIQVHGAVGLYKNRPNVAVYDPSQIKIITKN